MNRLARVAKGPFLIKVGAFILWRMGVPDLVIAAIVVPYVIWRCLTIWKIGRAEQYWEPPLEQQARIREDLIFYVRYAGRPPQSGRAGSDAGDRQPPDQGPHPRATGRRGAGGVGQAVSTAPHFIT